MIFEDSKKNTYIYKKVEPKIFADIMLNSRKRWSNNFWWHNPFLKSASNPDCGFTA